MIMKRIIFLAALFISSLLTAHAYDLPDDFNAQFAIGNVTSSSATQVGVRASPSSQSEEVDFLDIGEEFEVIEHKQTEVISGVNARWLNVSYSKDGTIRQGYIWQAEAANNIYFLNGEVSFILEFAGDIEHRQPFSLKAINQSGAVAEAKGNVGIESTLSYSITEVNAEGLEQLETIVKISFDGASCAVGSYSFYYGWNGEHFIELPAAILAGDGTASREERTIFPSQGAPYGTVIKVISMGEQDAEGEMHYKYATQVYEWNGDQIIPQRQNTQVLIGSEQYWQSFK